MNFTGNGEEAVKRKFTTRNGDEADKMGIPGELLFWLSKHFNPNQQDWGFGRTALHWASRFGHFRCMLILLNAGGDPLITDKLGQTPLDLSTNTEEGDDPMGDEGRKELIPVLKETATKAALVKIAQHQAVVERCKLEIERHRRMVNKHEAEVKTLQKQYGV
jgi:hypothetical protein